MFLPAALRAAQSAGISVTLAGDFEVFLPAGATRCTDWGEIWRGGVDRRSTTPRQIYPNRCRGGGVGPPKLKILLKFCQNFGI